MKHNIRRLLSFAVLVCMIVSMFAFQGCAKLGDEAYSDTDATTGLHSDNELSNESTSTNKATTSKKPKDEAKDYAKDESKAPKKAPVNNEPSDHISKNGDVKVTMTEIFKISDHTDSNKVHCRIVQGGCTDGTYYYVALNSGGNSTSSITAILKYEIATGKLVRKFENLKVAHANDMTYNSDTKELLIAHHEPTPKRISILDPETMKVKRVVDIQTNIYAISYDPHEKCYWAAPAFSYTCFVKLDLNFKQVGEIFKGFETGYTKQGMDVDSKYIYLVQYKTNSIIVHDKAGNFVRKIVLPKTSYEPENIFHIGDVFYIGYYKSKAGGMLYKTVLEQTGGYNASISLTKFSTVTTRTDANNNVYSSAQGSCSDGKYLYLMMNNNNSSNYLSSLHKIDLATGKTVQTVDKLDVGSANDMTYNSKTGQIVIATSEPDKYSIVVMNANTLKVVKDVKINLAIYSIAYDAQKNGYWLGISDSYNFAFVDASFKQVGSTYTGNNTGYTKQSTECANGVIYFLHSNQNAIVIYENDGSFATTSTLSSINSASAQSICYANGYFYIGCYVNGTGCVIYKAQIKLEK